MASISKISTQIVADARQFNSTVLGAEKLAQSIFARMAKLEFIPGTSKLDLANRVKGIGPVKIDAERGDSLQAVYDLLDRIRKRATSTGDAISRALNPNLPNTIRVPQIDNRNQVGPVQPLRGRTPMATVSQVSFTKLPDQGAGPFAPRQQYVSNTPDSVKNRALFPVEISHAMGFRDRVLAVYKSIGSAAKLAGIVIGQALSHPGAGGAKEFGAAWRDSFGRLIPSARQLYRALSTPVQIAVRVIRPPLIAVNWTLRRVGQSIGATSRNAASSISSMMPSPYFAALSAAASLGLTTYQLNEYAHKVAAASIETKNFAVSSGAGSYEIQRMQFALRYMGQEASGAIEALKTIEQLQVTSRIGDYATTDLLDRMGGSAKNVLLDRTKDVQDAMNAVDAAITSQGAGVRSVALAMHVYGDNAERVLRFALLTANTKSELEERMLHQGNLIGPDDISKLQQMELMVGRIKLNFEGMVAKALVAFGPIILTTLEMANQFMSGFQTDKMLADIKGFALQVAAFVLNLPSYFEIASSYIVLAIGRIGEAIDTVAARLYRFQADLAGILRNSEVRDSSNAKADALEAAIKPGAERKDKPWYSQMADDAVANIARVRGALTTVDQLQTMLAIRSKLAVAQQVPRDLYTAMMGNMRSQKLLIDGAMQTALEVEQPFEKLRARLNALDLMRGIKANMSDGTFGRALMKAFGETESQLQLTDIRLPGLANKDSTEAVSAINRSEVEYRLKVADTPAVRQQRILEQSYEVLQLIRDYALRSADAAEQRKIVSLPK